MKKGSWYLFSLRKSFARKDLASSEKGSWYLFLLLHIVSVHPILNDQVGPSRSHPHSIVESPAGWVLRRSLQRQLEGRGTQLSLPSVNRRTLHAHSHQELTVTCVSIGQSHLVLAGPEPLIPLRVDEIRCEVVELPRGQPIAMDYPAWLSALEGEGELLPVVALHSCRKDVRPAVRARQEYVRPGAVPDYEEKGEAIPTLGRGKEARPCLDAMKKGSWYLFSLRKSFARKDLASSEKGSWYLFRDDRASRSSDKEMLPVAGPRLWTTVRSPAFAGWHRFTRSCGRGVCVSWTWRRAAAEAPAQAHAAWR